MNPYADRINQALAILDACEEATWQTIEDLKATLRPHKRGRKARQSCRCGQPIKDHGLCEACLRAYNRNKQREFRERRNETR